MSHNHWGNTDVEGKILSKNLGIKIHCIEKFSIEGKLVYVHTLIDGDKVIQVKPDYNDPSTIHIINNEGNHFNPVLRQHPKNGQTLMVKTRSKTRTIVETEKENQMKQNEIGQVDLDDAEKQK
ncbi:hypothetical protein PSTG_18016, partial [Puccinia striiformis f. sp. tritici PST-78]